MKISHLKDRRTSCPLTTVIWSLHTRGSSALFTGVSEGVQASTAPAHAGEQYRVRGQGLPLVFTSQEFQEETGFCADTLKNQL